jgi:hypothetical protein
MVCIPTDRGGNNRKRARACFGNGVNPNATYHGVRGVSRGEAFVGRCVIFVAGLIARVPALPPMHIRIPATLARFVLESGSSSGVERQLPKLDTRVRFSSPAPFFQNSWFECRRSRLTDAYLACFTIRFSTRLNPFFEVLKKVTVHCQR